MEQILPNEVDLIQDEPNYAPLWCLCSVGFFGATRLTLSHLVPSKAVSQGPVTVWKWVNIANSLLHSLITGVGALICFYVHPRQATDVVTTYSTLSHGLVAFSSGYFVFDCLDMLMNHRKRSSYELIIHHLFVLSCFLVSIITRYYLGYAIVALVVEVNSIFLHWRQLLLLNSTPKGESYFRGISLANLFTFVIFRIVTLGWMTRWLALNADKVPLSVYALGCVAMTVLVAMSIVLFFRLLKADFHKKSKEDKDC